MYLNDYSVPRTYFSKSYGWKDLQEYVEKSDFVIPFYIYRVGEDLWKNVALDYLAQELLSKAWNWGVEREGLYKWDSAELNLAYKHVLQAFFKAEKIRSIHVGDEANISDGRVTEFNDALFVVEALKEGMKLVTSDFGQYFMAMKLGVKATYASTRNHLLNFDEEDSVLLDTSTLVRHLQNSDERVQAFFRMQNVTTIQFAKYEGGNAFFKQYIKGEMDEHAARGATALCWTG